MAIASYTSEFDEKINYREALMDRLAELIIAHHKQLTNLDSIKTSQKVTKDGMIVSGGRTSDRDRIVLFRSDLRANDTDSPYIQQILNVFSTYGNTEESNYGVPVKQISLDFIGTDDSVIPVLSAPGIPGIELIEVEHFFNDNVSQFIDVSPEKQIFNKDKVKEFLNTSFQEILPKNHAMIKKINRWFQEFDLLKDHIEPGLKPIFQSAREVFESDKEQLTYFVRNSVDLLYPQTHPIYSAQNYYNTENTLIQLDYFYKSEKLRMKQLIDLQSIQSIAKDKAIKVITDRVIPLLTQKYTEQLQVEGADASFSQYQLDQISLAIRTGNYDNVAGNLIYNQNFEDIDVSPFTNDYEISNTFAREEGVVSRDFHMYKGIPIACKPNQWRSTSTWGVKNQYSGLWETDFTINQTSWSEGHSHRHFWGERHFWTETAYSARPDGHFTTSPGTFFVTHPDGTEFSVTVGSDYKTSLDNQSALMSLDRISGPSTPIPEIENIIEPPVGFTPAGGVLQNQEYTFSNNRRYSFHYNWGAHTRYKSGTDAEGISARETNMPCFLAYVGSDVLRFTGNAQILTSGLAVIFWTGEKWIYDRGNNSIKEDFTFKPNYNDFIICEFNIQHWHDRFSLTWIGSQEAFEAEDPLPIGAVSYHMGNRKGANGDWIAGGGRNGIYSGYHRRRFRAKGTESWRDHGVPSGTWGAVDVAFPQAPKPEDENETSQVLRLTIGEVMREQRRGNGNIYDGYWSGASKYYNFVGHDNTTGLTNLDANQGYRMFFTIRASRPNLSWEVKIGDYRNGHEFPIWEAKLSGVSEDSDWHVYQIRDIVPIKRGEEPSTHMFSEYNFPEENTLAQICVGIKPCLYKINSPLTPVHGGSGNHRIQSIEDGIGEWIEIENIEIYGDNILI